MGTREIVTLQFGHYSNFVGTHWWNIQATGFDYEPTATPSQIDHDVLFREGLTLQGHVTFTPRLLSVDLNGSLKALPQLGDLYDIPKSNSNETVEWQQDSVEVKTEAAEIKIPFQKDLESGDFNFTKIYDLDRDVRVWSDFSYIKYHPRTVNIIKQYQHQNDTVPFDIFPIGANLWKTSAFQDDFSDKIRNYIEECDSFQGFHVLLDCGNGFGGLSTSCIEYLRDEYSSKSIIAFPLIEPQHSYDRFETDVDKYKAARSNYLNLLNLTLTFDQLLENSCMFIPLSVGDKGFKHLTETRNFNHVVYNPHLPYHSSAILASALETFTLKYRQKTGNYALVDLCADLTLYGRKLCAASVCLPFCLNKNQDLIDCLNNWDGPLTRTITPNCNIGCDNVMQLMVLRGVAEDRLKRPPNQAPQTQKDMPAYQCNSIKEMLNFYMSCTTYASPTDITVVNKPMSVRTPYPKFFDGKLDCFGNVDSCLNRTNYVESVPVLAGLHNGEFIGNTLQLLLDDVKTIRFQNFHQYHNEGTDVDEFKECLARLLSLRECYENNYDL